MPPGMVMTRDTPDEALRKMVDSDEIDYTVPVDAQGGQLLEPRIEDGVARCSTSTSR